MKDAISVISPALVAFTIGCAVPKLFGWLDPLYQSGLWFPYYTYCIEFGPGCFLALITSMIFLIITYKKLRKAEAEINRLKMDEYDQLITSN
ncbi:MAG: hypothetical protein ACWA44_02645 [Thiotrichales bacterium]